MQIHIQVPYIHMASCTKGPTLAAFWLRPTIVTTKPRRGEHAVRTMQLLRVYVRVRDMPQAREPAHGPRDLGHTHSELLTAATCSVNVSTSNKFVRQRLGFIANPPFFKLPGYLSTSGGFKCPPA